MKISSTIGKVAKWFSLTLLGDVISFLHKIQILVGGFGDALANMVTFCLAADGF